jgi:serine/threonine protein kinase
MGEVYRARDKNLDRDVAIKVLPESLAQNAMNLARMEREAKAIAALSHPNILAVFDFQIEEGTAFLVTELLEGQTLGERLAEGPLPPRKVTELGRQIARGLGAAHDKGIVHRDLKPDNLFLTGDGRVKILDFGLASDSGSAGQEADRIEATITNLTQPGTVLGTVYYMSPEQVRGKPTDNRSDLFSLGSVLYEMVTGKRPFQSESQPETMTAILREEPADLVTLAPDIPPALGAIIRRCLEKAAAERFHSAHDLAFSLEALSRSTVSTGTAAAITDYSGPRRRPGVMWIAGLVLLGVALGVVGWSFLRPSEEPVSRGVPDFSFLSSRRGVVTNARFTGTDGSALYSATWDGEPLKLYPASPDSRTTDPLSFTNVELLSISSTGDLALSLNPRYPLGWEVIGTLAVAQCGGTAPRQILDNVMGADWAPDGQTLAVAREVDGVVQLEYPIGTVLYRAPGWISALRVSPDGERVVFADNPSRGDNAARVRIVDRGGEVTDVARGGSWGVLWDPDGQRVWHSGGGRIFRTLPGEERELVFSTPNVTKILDVSATGQLLAASASIRREIFAKAPGATTETNLSWLDWSTPTILGEDGKLLLFEEGNEFGPGGYAVYLRQTDGAAPLFLGYGSGLALSPDQKMVAIIKRKFQPDAEIVLTPIGLGEPVTLPLGDLRVRGEGAWVAGAGPEDPDDLVILCRKNEGPPQLFAIPLDSEKAPRAVTPVDLPLSSGGHIVSGDGKRVIVKTVEGAPVAFSMDGQGPVTVPGLEADDLPLGFDRDGTHCFVLGMGSIPAPIFLVNLETGERTLWRELVPTDRVGVNSLDRVRISAEGDAHVYSVRRTLSQLVVIEGL